LFFSTLLDVLRLENLRLSGTIPEDVRNMTRLCTYSIGVLLTSYGILLTDTTYIYPCIATLVLRNNSLTGTIPTGLGEMDLGKSIQDYTSFCFSFTCLVVAAYFCCCFVTDEACLDCNENNLRGSIPMELGHQTLLHSLKVAENMLNGTLPSEMETLPSEMETLPSEMEKLTNLGKLGFRWYPTMWMESVSVYLPSDVLQNWSIFQKTSSRAPCPHFLEAFLD
jgi:hypothetical protein